MQKNNLQSASNAGFHPVHAVYDGVFNTLSGKKFNLLSPSVSMIDIDDVANALSKICRFGGHIDQTYNVAQHSVLVCHLAPESLKREALMHDAAEAYIGDVIKPLKVLLGAPYQHFETTVMAAIIEKFGLCPEKLKQIKQYDRLALEIEYYWFQRKTEPPHFDSLEIPTILRHPLESLSSKQLFKRTFNSLFQ